MSANRTETPAPAPLADLAGPSRRSFLQRSLATGAAVVPAALLASTPATGQAALPGRPLPELYRGENRRFFNQIRVDEDNHVTFLVDFLGGTINQGGKARPKPAFKGLVATSYLNFVELSATFENTGAGAYQGAAAYIAEQHVLQVAASIGFVEAYHSGYLDTLLNLGSIFPTGGTPNNSFGRALTFAEVSARLLPYLANPQEVLSVVPLPTTMPSPENDVAIANFALIAEYLEREFYDINVRRIFG